MNTSSPISDPVLAAGELDNLHAYWRACNYLAAGMIYLRDNPLLREPLRVEHTKQRLLGHWGASPGLSFTYVHLNRLINKYDLDAIFLAGPGHGAPGVLAPVYLEGVYSEVSPNKGEDEAGLRRFLKSFSFPGSIGSHCMPETPGSIHEGGELGYSVSHAFGAAFDNPDLPVAVMVGDGEAETGPLATAWHSNKFLNPIRDGAVLPILHLNGYEPHALFDEAGRLRPELKALAPKGKRHMSANSHANGGLLRRALHMPDFRDYAAQLPGPGKIVAENTRPLGKLLRDVMAQNMDNFRVFGPDENASNKLDNLYEVTQKTWLADIYPEDAGGSELSPEGRVMEMLSEHTLEGWLEGYLLTGRHGFLSTYEAFVHVIDSMFNQHAKWLAISREIPWRAPVASLNLLITSTVWRQDHNGFTHQDPGFLDVVVNKSPAVTRIYLPPDVNTLLVAAAQCLESTDTINVIVCDKQKHLQYLDMDAAIQAGTKGIGIWEWASNDAGAEQDVVMASAGDIPTKEALAATVLLREHFPGLKLRFINVVDLYKLVPPGEHPHGLPDRDFDSLFTLDRPVIFNFHGYPWLIHRLAYRRTNHDNMHVRGYKEKGSINTPLELAIDNEIDRFSLAIDVINRVPALQVAGAHVKEKLRDMQIECRNYAHEHGVDLPEADAWRWPY